MKFSNRILEGVCETPVSIIPNAPMVCTEGTSPVNLYAAAECSLKSQSYDTETAYSPTTSLNSIKFKRVSKVKPEIPEPSGVRIQNAKFLNENAILQNKTTFSEREPIRVCECRVVSDIDVKIVQIKIKKTLKNVKTVTEIKKTFVNVIKTLLLLSVVQLHA